MYSADTSDGSLALTVSDGSLTLADAGSFGATSFEYRSDGQGASGWSAGSFYYCAEGTVL